MSMRYPGGLINGSPVTAQYPSGVWTPSQTNVYNSQNVWQYDQYWRNTTLLLHGDGTNGAQNNTFLDSSSNNFSITRNGNTTQGSFTPYQQNGYWSNYFDGNGDYLSFTDNAAFAVSSGNWTLEAWVYLNSYTGTTAYGFIYDGRPQGVNGYYLTLYQNNGTVRFYTNGNGVINSDTGTIGTIPIGKWTHIAVCKSGNATKMFFNGSQVGTTYTDTNTYINGTARPLIGSNAITLGDYLNGYVSNLRLVKGTALYTSDFVPPTQPLTAISNTSLLTCQSNRFIDNSTNAFTVTRNGNTSVQAFQPFPGATTWSASVLGGSGYFDGSGDYLVTGSNSALAMGTGDFTWEGWIYFPSDSSYRQIFSSRGSTGLGGSLAVNPSNGLTWYTNGFIVNYTTSIGVNQWNHVAVTRSGTTLRVFANGVQVGSATNSQDMDRGVISLGANNPGDEPFTGYISNVRIVKGTAVYTGAYTVPTAPLSAISGTSLFCNFTNAGIFDNAQMNNLETVGNAQVSTSVVKYGTGSMYFDGSGDWLTAVASPNFAFGTSDYTVEFWLYKNPSSGERGVFQTQTASAYGLSIFLDDTEIYVDERYTTYSGSDPRVTTSFPSNQWVHIAVCRAGGTSGVLRLFKNGILVSSTTSNLRNMTSTGPLYVGYQSASANPLNGYIDDLRITKGVARYVTSFTPPIARMPNQ